MSNASNFRPDPVSLPIGTVKKEIFVGTPNTGITTPTTLSMELVKP